MYGYIIFFKPLLFTPCLLFTTFSTMQNVKTQIHVQNNQVTHKKGNKWFNMLISGSFLSRQTCRIKNPSMKSSFSLDMCAYSGNYTAPNAFPNGWPIIELGTRFRLFFFKSTQISQLHNESIFLKFKKTHQEIHKHTQVWNYAPLYFLFCFVDGWFCQGLMFL